MPATESPRELISALGNSVQKEFLAQNYVLSFDDFLDVFVRTPLKLSRNAASYIKDMIDHYGIVESETPRHGKRRTYKIFQSARGRNRPAIVGQDAAHDHLYRVLEQFVRQGKVDKLVLLHGPNGSSKSSTCDALAHALEEYSRKDEGCVYKFNWIFPNEKSGWEGLADKANGRGEIGFGERRSRASAGGSFAHLAEEEISCRIVSEFRENPIFLLPKAERLAVFSQAFEREHKRPPTPEEIPQSFEEGALSSKNRKIFDSLLVAYQGDLEKVLRHVQVERFFYSSRYRVGIATVEPQMALDAQDRQLTMDKNLQNIPPVLQNIRLFEPAGELIDSNRGMIEFSDLLKRPLEAFKYLLTTIEKMNINLTSGVADLDLVMLASTNEKHLDAFKASPDWASFKGRFELIRVPYLLSSDLEQKIYGEDAKLISRTKPIGPHAIPLLAQWAVLTRLRQPDTDFFEFGMRGLISRLDPYEKRALYNDEELSASFSDTEKAMLSKLTPEILRESQSSVAYEGRFGASPREMKMLLYFAAQNAEHDSLSALALFQEIEKLLQDRSVYDYLQFEPRGGFHDVGEFLNYIKARYAKAFHEEFLAAMHLFDEGQYVRALQKYLRHAVAFVKKERVMNEHTGKNEDPSETVMEEIEALVGAQGDKREVRERFVAKIASWKVENRETEFDIQKVFALELQTIAGRIYESKREDVERVREGMLTDGSPDYERLPPPLKAKCDETFANLNSRFGYTRKNAWATLVFLRGRIP